MWGMLVEKLVDWMADQMVLMLVNIKAVTLAFLMAVWREPHLVSQKAKLREEHWANT